MTRGGGGSPFWAVYQGHGAEKHRVIVDAPFCRNMVEFIASMHRGR